MKSRFTIAGTAYDYLTDEVVIDRPRVDADRYRYLSGTITQDTRQVIPRVQVIGVFEQVAGSLLSCGGLWLELLRAGGGTFRPDTAKSFEIDVLAMQEQGPRLLQTRKGTLERKQALALITQQAFALDDPVLDELASLTDALAS